LHSFEILPNSLSLAHSHPDFSWTSACQECSDGMFINIQMNLGQSLIHLTPPHTSLTKLVSRVYRKIMGTDNSKQSDDFKHA